MGGEGVQATLSTTLTDWRSYELRQNQGLMPDCQILGSVGVVRQNVQHDCKIARAVNAESQAKNHSNAQTAVEGTGEDHGNG